MATTFGKYSIERKLGQGGMGAVYLAVDRGLNRRVALKVITSKDEELLERFQREAAAVAKLKHPNIVQVYESGVVPLPSATGGSARKQHYFTMDYIEGVSLEKLISSPNRPNIQNIARIIQQVASALHYAHSQQVIHRDIKPANIMISMPKDRPDKPLQPEADPSSGGGRDNQGKAYITDFGLAKQLTGLDRSLTMSGTALGTPDYMSPEQAQGKKDEVDPRSDIFSLGATLYHCLTGRMPFPGNELYEVLSKVINEDPPAPSSVIKIIPKDLETICLKCLNKDKAKRYQTGGALAQDLKRYLEGGQITAKRTSSITKIYLKLMKNKTASLSIIGAAVILAVVIIGLLVSSSHRKQLIARYRQEAQQAFDKDQFDQARALCNKLLVLSPADEEIKGILKRCEKIIKAQETKKQQEDAQAKEAAAKAQKAVDLRNEAKAVLDRAAGAPTPEQKIKLAEEALAIDPTFGDAYQIIGYIYKDKKDYDKAVESFTKAIELTPTLAYSYYERGLIAMEITNKTEEAVSDFENVLKYDPASHIGWFAKGKIEYFRSKYDEAISDFTKAIETYSSYVDAYNARGATYMDKASREFFGVTSGGLLNKAVADFNEAIRLDPQYASIYANRCGAYVAMGELDKAIADCNTAIKLDPRYTPAYFNRGNAYKNKAHSIQRNLAVGLESPDFTPDQLLDRAIADYSQAIRLNPQYAEAYANRGNSYKDKNQLDKAMADFDEAIRVSPKFAAAYVCRGIAYVETNQLDKAIKDYTEAINLDPNNIRALNNRGTVYNKTDEFDKAIIDFNEALRINPNCAEAYINRGIAYENKDLLDQALADYNQAISLNPKFIEAYWNRANVHRKKGDLDRVVSDYTEAINLNPNDVLAYNWRGKAYSEKGELDKAILDYTESIRLNPQSDWAYTERGLAYFYKGELDRAISDYTESIRLKPMKAMLYADRAEVYANKNESDKAILDCNEAIRLDSNHASAYAYRGYACAKKGELERAVADCNETIKLDPKSVDGYLYRAKVYAMKNDFKQAISDGEMFLKLAPNHPLAEQMRRSIEKWKAKLK
ncbi:MAG: tetratricopeptide repeat protein [Planctomycetota bacterium]